MPYSVTCHPAEVTVTPVFQPIKAVLDFATLETEECKSKLT